MGFILNLLQLNFFFFFVIFVYTDYRFLFLIYKKKKII